MKTSLAAAEFGGAVRWNNLTTQDRKIHPAHYRMYAITTAGSGDIIDLVLPSVQNAHKMAQGTTVYVINRGIQGNLRLKLAPGYFWNFTGGVWQTTATSACLIGPGYVAKAIYFGSPASGVPIDMTDFECFKFQSNTRSMTIA